MHHLFAHPRSEDLLAQANGLRRDVDKLILSYVFEGVFLGLFGNGVRLRASWAQKLLKRKVLMIGQVASAVRRQCHEDRRVMLIPL